MSYTDGYLKISYQERQHINVWELNGMKDEMVKYKRGLFINVWMEIWYGSFSPGQVGLGVRSWICYLGIFNFMILLRKNE